MGTIRSPKERPTISEPTMTPTTNMVTAPPTGAPPANPRPRNQLVKRLAINIPKMGHGSVRPAYNFMKYKVGAFATGAIAIIRYTLSIALSNLLLGTSVTTQERRRRPGCIGTGSQNVVKVSHSAMSAGFET